MVFPADRDLLDAAKSRNVVKARTAIANGANLRFEDPSPRPLLQPPPPPARPPPPLFIAASNGGTEVVEVLLDNGVPVDARDEESGGTALIAASAAGEFDTVSLLLDRGADPNARTLNAFSALMFASAFGHFPVTTLLIASGAEVNVQNNLGNAPLQLAAHNSGDTDTVVLLLNKGANIDARSNDGWTALIDAIDMNHVAAAKVLIERGANVNLAAQTGWTALMASAVKGHADLAAMLIAHGADVNAKAFQGTANPTTALSAARSMHHADVVKVLEQAGARQ
jgi:hypothetical protein